MSDAPDFSTMTLADLEALASRFGAAVKTIQEARALLGGAPTAPIVARAFSPDGFRAPQPVAPASPYPCAMCGRAGPVTPAEQANFREGMPECGACGNPMMPVGAKVTNKGHPVRALTITPETRAALLSQPALDANGEPT